ncbi:MAG: polymer-forming cytoskeletal protein [Zoogloeaceae bacterium]|jgi:cytoskeletal protein CcmA (bactofilin family)|nr:polymer-forming cytoskeletal protein [Zoogloeaceae bacterium]
MFNKKTTTGAATQIDSLIGKGTKIEGNLFFSGGLRVDGEIHGKVIGEAPSTTLVLSEHGVVNGHVEVTYLVANGSINGPVRATEFLELQPKARIEGDMEYGMIEIQQGAVIEGRLLRLTPESAGKTEEPLAEKTEKPEKPEKSDEEA